MTSKTALRIGCMISLFLASYPLAALLAFWQDTPYTYWALLLTLGWLIAGAIGGIIKLLFLRQYKRKPRSTNVIFFIIAVVLLAFCLLLPFQKMWLAAIYGIGVAIAFWCGIKWIDANLMRLFRRDTLLIIIAGDVILGFICRACNETLSLIPIIFILMANALLYALVQHTYSVDDMLHDRGSHVWHLPEEMKKSGTRMMLLFSGIGVVLLCLTPLLTRLLRIIGGWIWSGIRALLQWLLSGRGDTASPAVDEEVAPSVVMEEGGTSLSWIWDVIEVTIVVVIIVILIWRRREIGAFIRDKWNQVRQWFSREAKQTSPSDEEHDYYDYTEDILTQEKMAESIEKTSYSARNWRKFYREFMKMSPNAEKYRLGYALLLAKLPEEENVIVESTEEILAERDESVHDKWAQVTSIYNKVRYGKYNPQKNDFIPLEELLKTGLI